MCWSTMGAMYGTRQLSKDGIELTWAVNHLAPFLLTMLLLERLKASAPARSSPPLPARIGRSHPLRRSECRARLSRLRTRRGDQSRQHVVHGRAGASIPRYGRDSQLLPSGARCHGIHLWQWAAHRHWHDGPQSWSPRLSPSSPSPSPIRGSRACRSAAPTARSLPGSSPKSVKQNIREILTGGTREVSLAFGTPRPLSAGASRKALAKETRTRSGECSLPSTAGHHCQVPAE